MTEQELIVAVSRIEVTVLRRWVALGWIVPDAADDAAAFDDQDVARAALICDLVYDLQLDEESVPVVLSLIDQLHEARRALRSMAAAIEAQPDEVRQRIARVLAESS